MIMSASLDKTFVVFYQSKKFLIETKVCWGLLVKAELIDLSYNCNNELIEE